MVEGARLEKGKSVTEGGPLGSEGISTCSASAPERNKPPTPPVAEALLQVRVQQILIPTHSVYKPGCLGEAHLPETEK